MEPPQLDDEQLKAAGAELIADDGRRGVRIHGWVIESRYHSILNSSALHRWEQKFQTSHLPEMVFGDNSLCLKHVNSGTKIHFNAFNALRAWKRQHLPPVQVPAAALWKFRRLLAASMPLDEQDINKSLLSSLIVEVELLRLIKIRVEEIFLRKLAISIGKNARNKLMLLRWHPILFYDEVVLYEDELADNGVSLLTVKVRVMPNSWSLLLRFWIRLRETRMHCVFRGITNPMILRECCWRESTFEALAAKGHPFDSGAYNDPSIISGKLPIVMLQTQKLVISS